MTNEQVKELLSRVTNTAKELAEVYGISPHTVAKIRYENKNRGDTVAEPMQQELLQIEEPLVPEEPTEVGIRV